MRSIRNLVHYRRWLRASSRQRVNSRWYHQSRRSFEAWLDRTLS